MPKFKIAKIDTTKIQLPADTSKTFYFVMSAYTGGEVLEVCTSMSQAYTSATLRGAKGGVRVGTIVKEGEQLFARTI